MLRKRSAADGRHQAKSCRSRFFRHETRTFCRDPTVEIKNVVFKKPFAQPLDVAVASLRTRACPGGVFHVSTEKNLAIDHPVRRFLDPHLHPSGLIDNIAAVLSPDGYLPLKNPLPERVVRSVLQGD